MNNSEIAQRINAFLTDTLEMDAASLEPSAQLKADLGLTSLDALEISIFIKRTFGFEPAIREIKALVTLQDMYDYILAHQS